MVANLTGDDLYAWALVLRNVDKRTILFVEGDSDASALDPHISADHCQSVIGNGKKAVMRAVEIARERDDSSVIGLVDREFAGILEPDEEPDGVFYTDCYDLDSTILSFSEIVERVVSSHCDRGQLERDRTDSGSDYLKFVVGSCRMIAALRASCKQSGMSCSTRDLPLHAFLDERTGELDVSRFVRVVQSRCNGYPIPGEDELTQGIQSGLAMIPEGSACCSGHDLLAALAFVMHKRWGAGPISARNLGRVVRSSMDCRHLKQTRFYSEIREWSHRSKLTVWKCVHLPEQRSAS